MRGACDDAISPVISNFTFVFYPFYSLLLYPYFSSPSLVFTPQPPQGLGFKTFNNLFFYFRNYFFNIIFNFMI